MGTELRRITEDQRDTVLKLLSAGGGTARTEKSWRQDRMTALLLGDEAAMPISARTIAVGPGRTAEVGWLSSNQFASRMSLRRRTRETARQWPELLPEFDAVVVVRRDEASLAGRWYQQTGFADVLSIRCLYLDMTDRLSPAAAGPRYQVEVISGADAADWQNEMRSVYQDVYAGYGGPVVRSENFWSAALAAHYYGEHYQFQIVGLWTSGGELMGYAVVGWSGWHSKRPRMDILELATRQWDTAVASELIRTTCQLAWSKNVRQVRAVVSAHDPYRGHLARSGFIDRWGYVMLARWLHAQRYVDRIAAQLPAELGNFSLEAGVSGELPITVRRGSPTAPPLKLQGDRRAITRLLFQRLDITEALAGTGEAPLISDQGKVSETDVTRISMVFPWTPWVFHMLDFI